MCRSCALEACSRRDRLVQSSNHDMQFHAYLKPSTSRRSLLQAPILGASQRESTVQPSEHAKNKIPTNQPLLPPVDVLHASVRWLHACGGRASWLPDTLRVSSATHADETRNVRFAMSHGTDQNNPYRLPSGILRMR